MKLPTKWPLLLAVAGLMTSGHANAATVIALGEPTGPVRFDPYYQAGYGFYLPDDATITINQFGYWDQGGDGLQISHNVSLYQYNGSGSNYTLIASTTIDAGTVDPLVGGYRWVTVPDLVITENGQGGNYYVIMASHGTDAWTDGGLGTMDPTLGTVTANRAVNFTSPGGTALGSTGDIVGDATPPYGGGNFGFTAVPEPSTTAVAVLSVLGLGFFRSRRRA